MDIRLQGYKRGNRTISIYSDEPQPEQTGRALYITPTLDGGRRALLLTGGEAAYFIMSCETTFAIRQVVLWET